MKVCLDAGHGGKDSGAVGQRPFTRQEKDINLKIAPLEAADLNADGRIDVLDMVWLNQI